MTIEDLIISLDRLTRFKNPEIKYKRVFYDIILKHLITPSISKHKLDELSPEKIISLVEQIWNSSVESLFSEQQLDISLSKQNFSLTDLDNFQYNVSDEYTQKLMSANLKFYPILQTIDENSDVLNLKFLKILVSNIKKNTELFRISQEIRYKYKTLFPVKKLILTEGITEEILLPQFAKVSGFNFKEQGVFILATGGKSKVLSIYAELKYILKIPVFILLDNDAEAVYKDVVSVIRVQDRAYLIKAGEFEDILDKRLIQKAFEDMNYDIQPPSLEELYSENGTVEALEFLWKSRNLGEFRKAHLAKAVREVLNEKSYITEEINEILKIIRSI
jgi:hypothetical protein